MTRTWIPLGVALLSLAACAVIPGFEIMDERTAAGNAWDGVEPGHAADLEIGRARQLERSVRPGDPLHPGHGAESLDRGRVDLIPQQALLR